MSTARTITISSNPASRGWRAPCGRRARSTRGAPARSPRPRAPSAAHRVEAASMTTAIIDYGSGNLRSAAKAFERAVVENGLDDTILVTSRPEDVARAERIVLPGGGAFADCRRGLAAVPGLEAALEEAVMARGRPFLGICVGMQLMASCGREFETVAGLGWVPGEVVAIERADPALKIPHMGWNELLPRAPHPVLAGLPSGTHTYFVHGYHFRPAD